MILGRSPKPSELLTFCLQRGCSDIPRTEEKVRAAAAGLVDLGNPTPRGTPELSFHVHSSIFALIVLVQLPQTLLALSEAPIPENKEERAGKAEESSLNHLQTCRRLEEMSPGMGDGPKGDTMGRAVHSPSGTNSSTLATHRRKVKREQAVSLALGDPQDTGQTGAISKIGREQEGTSWQRAAQIEGEEKEPCQMQTGPQHACFPSLAHESRG